MANKFWGLTRKLEHPNYNIENDSFKCPCGIEFPAGEKGAIRAHALHVSGVHGRDYAEENIPARLFDEIYKTERWQMIQKKKEENKLIRKAGFKKTKGIFKYMGAYSKGEEFFSREEALKLSKPESHD